MSTASPSPDTAAKITTEAFQPIASYGLLADCNSAALVDLDGSVGWLCLPRYDSPAVFARILDREGGHWSITPTGTYRSERRYRDGSLVIETTFITESGSIKLTDAMAFAEGQRHHELGLAAPHMLLRLVQGLSGEVELELELAPRPEYGLVKPLFRETQTGGRTFGGPNQLVISAGVPTAVEDSTMRATFSVGAGEQVGFALQWVPPQGPVPEQVAPDEVAARIDDTAAGWSSWEQEHDIYDGPHRELVRLSSRVLKGLTYRPTGAIVAA
ncbi:MAG: trehalase-like domain-containing protein, partial [Solirubrobacteraceae bacterium]